MRSRRRALVAILACLAACSTRETTAEPPRGRVEGDVAILVAGAEGIEVHRKDTGGRELPVARLESIDFHDGARAMQLAIRSWERVDSGLSAIIESPLDHDIRLSLRLTGSGAIDVELVDRVDTFARVSRLGLRWRFLSDEAIDQVELPLAARPDAASAASDAAFRAPLAFLRDDHAAMAIVPDLSHLARDRPIPHRLEYRPPPQASLVHALAHPETTLDSDRTPASVVVRRDSLRLRHRLFTFSGPESFTARQRLRALTWQEVARDRLAIGHDVLGSRALSGISNERLLAVQRSIESATSAGAADPLAAFGVHLPEANAVLVSFGTRANALSAALAFELGGRRAGNDGWRELASSITIACLAAPIRSGLFPAGKFRRTDDTGDRWSTGEPSSVNPDAYSTQNAALCGRHLIELGRLREDLKDRIRHVTDQLARFLRDNQAVDGSMAAHFDGEFLRPLPHDGGFPLASTAAASLFLIEHAAWSGDQDSRRAAQRALDYLVVHAARPAWFVNPDRVRGRSESDEGTPCLDLVPLTLAAEAAVQLARDDPQRQGDARTLLDELHALQQVWDPPWLEFRTFGGFAPTNRESGWNDPFTSRAARALLDGYRVLGDRDDLERGVAALRASMAREGDCSTLESLGTIAVAEHARRELGDVVLDVANGFAIGIENLQVARLTVSGSRVGFNLGSTVDLTGPALLRVTGANAVPEVLTVNNSPQDRLERAVTTGLPVVPLRLPTIEFAPPHAVAAGELWQPVALVSGRQLAPRAVFVMVDQANGVSRRLPMVPVGDGTSARFVLDPLSEGVSWSAGVRFTTQLVCQVDGFEIRVPRVRGADVQVGEWNRVDPGDDLELELRDGSASSSVVRFPDGRENARRVAPGASLEYWIEVPRDAAEVELRLRVVGTARVSSAETGDSLAVVEPEARVGPRTIALRLADARLWTDGLLRLLVTTSDDQPLLLAHIDHRVVRAGAVTTGPGVPAAIAAPRTQLAVLAIPWQVGASRAPAAEDLRVALFGGEDYRLTPPPQPRPTAGSLARYVQRVSGGRTAITGEVIETVHADRLGGAAALPDRGGTNEPPPELLARLGEILESRTEQPDVVLVVHDGAAATALDRLESIELGGVPLRFVGERAGDGSYVSTGRLARTVLSAIYPMRDLATPSNGAFGELALTSAGDVHAPPPPLAPNLLVTGWLSAIDVERSPTAREYRLAGSLEGRSALRFRDGATTSTFLLENLTHSGEPGLLAMCEFDEGTGPVCIRADGRSTRVRVLRLSPRTPLAASPFEPATDAELLRTTVSLDAWSRPPLCTPEGDAPWSVRGIEFGSTSLARLATRFEGVDLLVGAALWTRVGRGGEAPLPIDGVDRASGSIRRVADRVDVRPRGDAVVRGTFTLAGVRGPQRLRACMAVAGSGSALIRVALGGRELARFELGNEERRLRLDYATGSAEDRLVIDCIALAGAPVITISRLLSVPRSGADGAIPLSHLPTTTLTLRDGSVHALARTVSLDARGERTLRVPVVVPAGRSTLRLWLAWESSRPIRLAATLRGAESGAANLATFTHELGADRSSDVLLLEVPGGERPAVAFLELVCRGVGEQELFLLDAAVIRG
ncbi:MAG: hypothetical protein AB7I19_14600 [Planctomycetota bacterium]